MPASRRDTVAALLRQDARGGALVPRPRALLVRADTIRDILAAPGACDAAAGLGRISGRHTDHGIVACTLARALLRYRRIRGGTLTRIARAWCARRRAHL